MDTAPDAPGENIRARVTEAYDGGDVVLNEEKHIVLSPEEYPQMKHAIGKRLIVTDGTTRTTRPAWRRFCPRPSCCSRPTGSMAP